MLVLESMLRAFFSAADLPLGAPASHSTGLLLDSQHCHASTACISPATVQWTGAIGVQHSVLTTPTLPAPTCSLTSSYTLVDKYLGPIATSVGETTSSFSGFVEQYDDALTKGSLGAAAGDLPCAYDDKCRYKIKWDGDLQASTISPMRLPTPARLPLARPRCLLCHAVPFMR